MTIEEDIAYLKRMVRALAARAAFTFDENGDPVPMEGPCIFEARDNNGNMPTSRAVEGRAWCRVHGFLCPNLIHHKWPR